MAEVARLKNCVMPYPWGSRTALADLRGDAPAIEPEAEMWMGAHPKAPSRFEQGGVFTALDAAIDRDPRGILGPQVARRFGELPFLLKVLAAERALSIQAHPDKAQAAAGFARENAAGVDDERRNYRDTNHKPEILYALEPFAILRGFRAAADTRALCAAVGLPALLPDAPWSAGDDTLLPALFQYFCRLDEAAVAAGIDGALRHLHAAGRENDPTLAWLPKLAGQNPGDRGVFAPLYLHVVRLAPGQAIFTGPGVLHAYLEGVGVELMANSDNVLRGGLTAKHVDVDELLHVVRCEPQPPALLEPRRDAEGALYRPPFDDFALAVVEVAGRRELRTRRGVEILFCGRGEGEIVAENQRATCARGEAFLVPAAVAGYQLEGDATFFRATAG